MDTTDGQLLRSYARERSESAFTELVRRHIDLVYSAALRQVNGNIPEAEDVTQAVFTDLARKAATLASHASLAGWLYTSTRFLAANARRTVARRLVREQEAHAMNAMIESAEPESDWMQVRPLLDEAMHTLDPADREAVLLRHFERRSYSDIGAKLGLTENAARMRVDRALDKLQLVLAKRGLTSTALSLAALVGANAVEAAPAHLAGVVAKAAFASAGTVGLFAGLSQLVTISKLKLALAMVAAAGLVTWLYISRHPAGDNARETVSVPDSLGSPGTTNFTADLRTDPPATGFAKASAENDAVLHLQVVAADSGRPVPLVQILASYDNAWGDKKFTADRFGQCDVEYSSRAARRLQVWTQSEGFADTLLVWRTDLGEVIPTNYVARLDRATPICGQVLDPDGKPVAGATVELHLEDDPGGVITVPANHKFPWVMVTTDEDGRWRTQRVGEDVVRRLTGFAKQTNYLDSTYIYASWDRRTEQALRNGTHTFKLGRAAIVTGTVVDTMDTPIRGANVMVGRRNYGGTRVSETDDDGNFTIRDCEPGWQWLTVEADGYAATTMAWKVSAEPQSAQIVLRPGKVLRMRIANSSSDSISGATVYLEHTGELATNSEQVSVQASFQVNSDSEGRVVWTNAPGGDLRFGLKAPGYIEVENVQVAADGDEHDVILPSAPVLEGTVRDETTGKLLPKFRIGLGCPSRSPGSTNIEWARFDRFWVEFTNGTYRYVCDEPLVRGRENPGWAARFEAAGYAPHVSRIIEPQEAVIRMDVALHPAASTIVTVFKPDGGYAAVADVGLVFPGSPLQLIRGGLSRESSPGGSQMTTDQNGRFELRPDDTVKYVLIVSLDGYAEATPSALVSSAMVQLKPWGRLEVIGLDILSMRGNFQFEFGDGSLRGTSINRFEDPSEKGQPGGKLFSKMPPGRHKLVYWVTWPDRKEASFEIRPGELTQLDLSSATATNGVNGD
jgi:RNA polymerase sigma factor (sigma-70 family)